MNQVLTIDKSVGATIVARKGDTIQIGLKYPDGTDMTGRTFEFKVLQNKPGATAELTANNQNGKVSVSGTTVTIKFDPADTANVAQTSNQIGYSYTIREIKASPNGYERTLFYGIFVLNGSVIY